MIFAKLIFFAPFCTLILLSIIGLTGQRTNEKIIKTIVEIGQVISLISVLFVAGRFAIDYIVGTNFSSLVVLNKDLFTFAGHSLNFCLKLDEISIWFVMLSVLLSNIVGVFSENYLHRDSGFFRFFFLITLFLNGILILFMANNFQVLFIGWEVVGITSALLISFFTIRRETVDNALHAFWAYRVSDIGLLCASIILSALLPHYSFDNRYEILPPVAEYYIPLLFLLSAMGKSAQFPFSSWLPRAMEGPTSSSAIFYGGLSIHAGAYLLLRTCIEFQVPIFVEFLIALVGLISCLYGTLLSQVQSDVKSALAYASLAQVGIMFIEISLGWYNLAIYHCLGHAFLRTYQILKSASIIHEFIEYEDAHQSPAYKIQTSFLPLFVSQKTISKIFSLAFDLALRAASGPSRLVIFLEHLSLSMQKYEENWLNKVSKLVR